MPRSITHTPLLASEGGYDMCFANLPGTVINYFNTEDYALAKGSIASYPVNWEANQLGLKPQSFMGAPTLRL